MPEKAPQTQSGRVVIFHQMRVEPGHLGHAGILPPPYAHQIGKPLDHGPVIPGLDPQTLLRCEAEPHKRVIRDDVGPIPPARAPGGVHREQTKARHAGGDKGQALPEARVKAGDRALCPGHAGRATRIAGRLGFECGDQPRQQRRVQLHIRIQIGPQFASRSRIPGGQRAQLAALGQFQHLPVPAARRRLISKGAGARGGVVAAPIGHHQHLSAPAPRQRVRGQNRTGAGADPLRLVMGGQDDAQPAAHFRNSTSASQRGLSSSRWRRWPQLPHLLGR